MSRPSYQIPKNKCQWCYNAIGRYVLDCYCIVCEPCFQQQFHLNKGICHICQKPTNSKFFDGKDSGQQVQISHLFENVQQSFNKIFQVYRFQQEIANRYCKFLETKVNRLQAAINQLITISPQLQEFFNSRINGRKNTQTEKRSVSNLNRQLVQQPTVRPSKTEKLINPSIMSRQQNAKYLPQKSEILANQNYGTREIKASEAGKSSIYSKNSSSKQFFGNPNQMNYGSATYQNQAQGQGQKNYNNYQSKQLYRIHPNQKNLSGRTPKVPNVNMNTALKSAKSDEKRVPYGSFDSHSRNQMY